MKHYLTLAIALVLLCGSQDELAKLRAENRELRGQVEQMSFSKRITSVVDGYDVKTVNVWKDRTNRRLGTVGCLSNDTPIRVVKTDGEHTLIEFKTQGWVNNGFIK